MQEGEYTGVMVYDTEDVYSMPTHSPRKKSEEENTYYNLDPSPAPSPSTHKKKSVSLSLKSIVQFKSEFIKTYSESLFISIMTFYYEIDKEEEREEQAIGNGGRYPRRIQYP